MTEDEALEIVRDIGSQINASDRTRSVIYDRGEAIIATAMREAVAAETERCAGVVGRMALESTIINVQDLYSKAAAAIRADHE